jgi:hypothetical protein
MLGLRQTRQVQVLPETKCPPEDGTPDQRQLQRSLTRGVHTSKREYLNPSGRADKSRSECSRTL